MTAFLLLDTNAVPFKSNFRSAFWAAVFRLCAAKAIRPAISEVSLHEAVNLRREVVTTLVEAYANAHRKLSDLTRMQPAFLPSPEEVATNFESVLNERFTVIPLDGEHARQSFEREARRILPARAGVGGRDTAIWLTAVGLLNEGHDVHFVTSNSNDFGKEGLPDSMLAEIEGMSGDFTYYHSLNDFVDAIATKTAAPEIDSETVAAVFEDSIRSNVIIMLTDDEGGDDPQDRVLDSSLELTALKWVGTYVVDGAGLAMVKASYRFVDEPGRPEWAAGKFEAWFEFDPQSLAVEPAEVDSVDVQSR